jgi:D-3-phosphoglycerate dehydrogenase
VANTPAYCIEEVASHTLAFILCFARGIVAYDRAVHDGAWTPIASYPTARRPADTTVAVVGMGRIGARVATLASACGFRVVAHDPFVPGERIALTGARPVPLEEALTTGDIVTLHLPLTDDTRHLVDARALASMGSSTVLVNTCRGELVDEDALATALETGVIAGAGLDVFRREPLPESSPLRRLPNVLLTPHAAWYSPAALRDLPRLATEQVIDFLAGRAVPSIVNGVTPPAGDGGRGPGVAAPALETR